MRRASKTLQLTVASLLALWSAWSGSVWAAVCSQPVYLTFDTGHMGVAPLIAEVLQRQQVRVTFFAAQEKTREGDGTLGQHWSTWWREQARHGHEFASHTYDHAYWRADLPEQRFRIRPSSGSQAGQDLNWSAQDYCDNLRQAAARLQTLTGQAPLSLFRAPGGKTSPALLRAGLRMSRGRVSTAAANRASMSPSGASTVY